MTPELVQQTLRQRIVDFGERPAYLIFPEEFTAGRLADLFEIQPPENRGDGTTVTRVIFEGFIFLLIEES